MNIVIQGYVFAVYSKQEIDQLVADLEAAGIIKPQVASKR